MPTVPNSEIERVFREQYGRAVAVLVRVFGDIDLAEEAVQDAFATAVARWPSSGLPPAPAGWITTTARNRAIDRLRREASRDDRHAQAMLLQARDEAPEESPVQDDRLRLIFTCCHPALDRAAQVAFTLQLLGGLSTPEIARAFLVSESTMAQRLVRAKRKIRDARIPYRVPKEAGKPRGRRGVEVRNVRPARREQRMRATIDGTVVADAPESDLVVIEGNYYFPPASVTAGVLSDSPTPYTCPWKGAAQYHDITVVGAAHHDAAWSYPGPDPAAIDRVGQDFTGYVAFDRQQVTVAG